MVFKPDLTFVKLILAKVAPCNKPLELLKHLKLPSDLCVIDTNMTVIKSLEWYKTVPQNQLALFCLPKHVV